jgi:hypothetical protein
MEGRYVSAHHYHDVCMKNRGRAVEIKTRDGRIHRGIIDRVDPYHVYLKPLRGPDSFGGFGYGLFAFGIGIAFGAIVSLAFRPRYYW